MSVRGGVVERSVTINIDWEGTVTVEVSKQVGHTTVDDVMSVIIMYVAINRITIIKGDVERSM